MIRATGVFKRLGVKIEKWEKRRFVSGKLVSQNCLPLTKLNPALSASGLFFAVPIIAVG